MGEKTEVARPRRVVLDTYVAVSAPVFREGRLAWLREAWAAGRVVPLVSAETLAELVRVLVHPKLKLSDEETKNVLAHYMEPETRDRPRFLISPTGNGGLSPICLPNESFGHGSSSPISLTHSSGLRSASRVGISSVTVGWMCTAFWITV